MGVAGIWKFVNTSRLEVTDVNDKTIAIDANIWLHEGSEGPYAKFHPWSKAYLATIYRRVKVMLRYGIKPVLVFDGSDAISKRNPGNLNHSKGHSDVYQEAKELAKLLGVCIIWAPAEAEAQCAYLEQCGLVSGTVTKDFDYFLFGGKNLLSLEITGSSLKLYSISMEKLFYDLPDSEPSTSPICNREALIMFAILLGCDYYSGVKSIGFKKAFKLFSEWSDDYCAVKMLNNLKTDNGETFGKAGSYLQKFVPADLPVETLVDKFRNPNVAKLSALPAVVPCSENECTIFLSTRLKWKNERIEKEIKVLKKISESSSKRKLVQPTIKDYFPVKRNKRSQKID